MFLVIFHWYSWWVAFSPVKWWFFVFAIYIIPCLSDGKGSWNPSLQLRIISPKQGITQLWASYQIREIAGCACARNAGNVFPATDFKGNRKLAIPACITARASRTCRDACRGSLIRGGGENVPGIPCACATLNFGYLARGPCAYTLLYM